MTNSESCQSLLECLERIRRGPWRFVQLRGKPLGQEDINAGDVDLLGSPQSIEDLVGQTLQWSREGLCHVHLMRRKPRKVALSIFSPDGSQRLLFDLWNDLPQIDNGAQSLTYELCEPHLPRSPEAIHRLPLALEASLYLHHLSSKKKDLSQSRYQSFLRLYQTQCAEAGHAHLAAVFEETLGAGSVTPGAREVSHSVLHQTIDFSQGPVSKQATAPYHFWESLLNAPRTCPAITVMGCDGAGKTSLAKSLVESDEGFETDFTGKHLYRKSLTYKLAVIFLRPLTFQSREKFDELIAPACYLRACLGLRLKLLRWRKLKGKVLIDRNLIDFLYLDRKSDHPRFSRLRWLHRLFGLRIPVVHCVADFRVIQSRKDEMTRSGHERYDTDMGTLLSRRCPTDYLCFNNGRSLQESAQALMAIRHTLEQDD